MKMSIIFLIAMYIELGIGAYIGYSIGSCPSNETNHYDYYLDLDEDSIHIVTDHCIKTTIHFDELEEFIIRDNL